MEMFDYTRCDVATPDGVVGATGQTKQLDCVMKLVAITADGLLQYETIHMEEVPLNERPFPDPNSIMRWAGATRWVHDGWDHLYWFTGLINVGKWVAVILRGKLVGFQHEFDSEDFYEWKPGEDCS